jgi:hypothetical protein
MTVCPSDSWRRAPRNGGDPVHLQERHSFSNRAGLVGAHPIEEKNFPTDYRELQALLARRLDPCDAIIHLVGFYYGGEPDAPRRSWTQWEYYRATQGERHKPVYRFLTRENCQFDAQPTEDAEKQRLQHEHREHLKTPGGPIYYEFSTSEELRVLILSINELRELVRPRHVRIPFLPMREKFTGRRVVTFQDTLGQPDANEVNLPFAPEARLRQLLSDAYSCAMTSSPSRLLPECRRGPEYYVPLKKRSGFALARFHPVWKQGSDRGQEAPCDWPSNRCPFPLRAARSRHALLYQVYLRALCLRPEAPTHPPP